MEFILVFISVVWSKWKILLTKSGRIKKEGKTIFNVFSSAMLSDITLFCMLQKKLVEEQFQIINGTSSEITKIY